MSTTSTTTASAAHDHTLGDDPNFANCICVLTFARGDGTLFNANSLLEEDIIKLCVGMGQAYPDGVPWLTVMESVIVFHSSEEMLAEAELITSATVWHGDPIKVHRRPPTTDLRLCHSEGQASLWHPCTYPTRGFDSTTFAQ